MSTCRLLRSSHKNKQTKKEHLKRHMLRLWIQMTIRHAGKLSEQAAYAHLPFLSVLLFFLHQAMPHTNHRLYYGLIMMKSQVSSVPREPALSRTQPLVVHRFPLLLGTQQQDPCLCGLFKQILFTGYSNRFSSLPLSVSPVNKYHLLHLNLIRMFLGIHYPYLFLISPYQGMPAYLYQDPDKICTTPVILESSPTLAEQESNVTWYYTNFTFYTAAKNCHAGCRIA